MVLLLVLGLIDILGGALLALAGAGWIGGSDFLFYLGVFFFLKGVWSIISSAAASFYFDLLGIADFVAAISMFFVVYGMTHGIFFWFGIVIILKGLYSVFMDFQVS